MPWLIPISDKESTKNDKYYQNEHREMSTKSASVRQKFSSKADFCFSFINAV